MALAEDEIEAILHGIWSGNITTHSPSVEVYTENAVTLSEGVQEGYGATLASVPSSNAAALNSLNENVYFFSAAKTYQQINDMNILRFNESGTLRTFAQFREAAGPVFDTYNVNWLSTEFATATAQSQAASQWATIQGQKDVLPLLQYLTVGDDRVRDEHAAWHGIIRPVDDPFWDSNYPINGWTCRCTTVQLSSGSLSSLSSIQSNSDPLFSNNPGKTNLVFTETGADQHPYFSVPPQDQALSDNHFNLPPP